MRILLGSLLVILISCKSVEKLPLDKNRKEIRKNYFLSETQMQFTLEYRDEQTLQPVLLAREHNCATITGFARQKFTEAYPQALKFAFTMKLLHTLYTSAGGCRQVYIVSAPDLKKKLDG